MKNLTLLLTLTSAALLAGCQSQSTKEPSPTITAAPNTPAPQAAPATATVNLTGDWTWVCCDGHYHGDLKLQQDGAKLTGRMYDENDEVGGAIEGTVTGGKVQFTRTFGDDFRQDYTLTATDDGKKIAGDLDGTRDESVGAHFDATRK